MEFLIADNFIASLARLTSQEQKAVKMTAFDLQLDPTNPGMRFHKLDRAKDPCFWSVRVNADIRLIVHKTTASLMLCFVGHHDPAYAWAEHRRIERHPKTGAAQLVEIRERVEEITVRLLAPPAAAVAPKQFLFDDVTDDMLLACGVPIDWLKTVRGATEDDVLDVCDHLPQEASEALLNLATSGAATVAEAKPVITAVPAPPQRAVPPPSAAIDPFRHPDAQRRFRVITNIEELERALDYPWEKWAVFLHPAQRRLVERNYNGPARVSGSAGTGKTIVAIHRAAFLARRDPKARVLLTTFTEALSNALKAKMRHLVGNEPAIAERIMIRSITGIGRDMYADFFADPNIAAPAIVQSLLKETSQKTPTHSFAPRFLMGEWTNVADAWQLKTWEEYRDVARLGRKTRIGGRQREALWSIFEQVRIALAARNLVTWPDVFRRLTEHLGSTAERPFDFAVIDEAQDVGVAELRFLAALARPERLFFTGDLGQRIFQQPFSWKSLGVDVRGRSYALRVNYRTSHQIRTLADRLLPSTIADVDGNAESRRGTVSVFNGPPPEIVVCPDQDRETTTVRKWLKDRLTAGVQPHEIGVFVRSERELERANLAVKAAGAAAEELTDKAETTAGHIAIGTMHLAKGLEFRAVAVMACDDEIIPLQERIENVADDADLEEVYDTERHLLYVACTRARDHLLVTGVDPASEFLDDLKH